MTDVLVDPEPYFLTHGRPPTPYKRVPNEAFDDWVWELSLHICLAVEEGNPEHTNHYPCSDCARSASALAYKYAEREQ